MAWYPSDAYRWWLWGRHILVRFLGPRMDGDFIGFFMAVGDYWLPRPNTARPWELHVSIGYISELTSRGVSGVDLVNILGQRWAGKEEWVKIESVGCGGALNLDRDHPFTLDPILEYLHEHGGYGDRPYHMSL